MFAPLCRLYPLPGPSPVSIIGQFSCKPFYELSLLPDDEDDEEDDEEEEDEEEEAKEEALLAKLHLDDDQAHLLMDRFYEYSVNGELNRDAFEHVFETILGHEESYASHVKTLSWLYSLFDRNQNGGESKIWRDTADC